MPNAALPPQIVDLVRDVVHGQLGPFGADTIEVDPGEDHYGNAAIRVKVHYRGGEANPDPKVAAGTITKLNDALFAAGEERFAYISHVSREMFGGRKHR